MGALDKIFKHWEKETTEKNIVVNQCKKSCIECLFCEHNQNSQFNLVLQNLFNSRQSLDDVMWKDVNLYCGLNKDT